jgi:S-adenosylmethionine hydrolase
LAALPRTIVTLTTDFGLADNYAGVMKGVILGINPDAHIVDITHDIRPYDVLEGALAIAQAYGYFPQRSIHVVVVDPGVGTARRPLMVSADNHHFIVPDNGVLSLVLARAGDATVRHITSTHYFLDPVSQTFHGRDVFAPCAGWLSRLVEPEKFGDIVTDCMKFTLPQPKKVGDKLLKGVVLRVDRFGTLMSNITPADAPELFTDTPPPFKIVVGKTEVTKLRAAYGDGQPGEVFGIVGSSGYLEIAANRASASQATGAVKGADVGVVLG